MKTNPIIATTLTGLFINDNAWKQAHKLWFVKYSKKLNNKQIRSWAKKENYFDYVDKIMKEIYPNLNTNQKTIKAREEYFNAVLEYIKKNKGTSTNKQIIKYFKKLKKDFTIALISTTKDDNLKEILKITGLNEVFDIVVGSKPNEKDDFLKVMRNFVKNYAKPIIFVDSQNKIKKRSKITMKYFKNNNILYFQYCDKSFDFRFPN